MVNVRERMNGRNFAGRKIEASPSDGEERFFKKSGGRQTQENGEEAR